MRSFLLIRALLTLAAQSPQTSARQQVASTQRLLTLYPGRGMGNPMVKAYTALCITETAGGSVAWKEGKYESQNPGATH